MTKLLPASLAAFVLLITGCSSGNGAASPNAPETPSDATFCASLQDWAEAITTVGTAMNDLGTQMSTLEDPLNPPPADAMHAVAADILTASDAADASLLIAVANVDDPAVADALRQVNDVTIETARWMGEAARDADDLVAFASVIMAGMDRLSTMQDTINAIDTTVFDAYVMDRCGDLPYFSGS